eukprot:jgi/Chlat1/996/Chrsp108S01407
MARALETYADTSSVADHRGTSGQKLSFSVSGRHHALPESFWRRQLQFFKEQLVMEAYLLLAHWWWIPVLILVLWYHVVMTNVTHYLYATERVYMQGPLYDVFFDVFPDMTTNTSDDLEWFIIGLTVATCVLGVFVDYARPKRYHHDVFAVHIVRRLVAVYATGTVLRTLTFVFTTLPGSTEWCLPPNYSPRRYGEPRFGTYDPEYKKPTSATDFLFGIDITKGCGDLVFSGHTLLYLCCCLLLTQYIRLLLRKPLGYLVLIAGWLSLPVFVFFVLATHRHYSVDMVMPEMSAKDRVLLARAAERLGFEGQPTDAFGNELAVNETGESPAAELDVAQKGSMRNPPVADIV